MEEFPLRPREKGSTVAVRIFFHFHRILPPPSLLVRLKLGIRHWELFLHLPNTIEEELEQWRL